MQAIWKRVGGSFFAGCAAGALAAALLAGRLVKARPVAATVPVARNLRRETRFDITSPQCGRWGMTSGALTPAREVYPIASVGPPPRTTGRSSITTHDIRMPQESDVLKRNYVAKYELTS